MVDQPQSQSHPRPVRDPAVDEARLRQQALGAKLRQMFNEVVDEPVPEDFLEILRRGDREQGEK